MTSAGRILIMPKGDWSADKDYTMLDLVYHNGASWIARQDIAKGIEPTSANKDHWQPMSDVSIFDKKKQERTEKTITMDAKSSYTHTLDRRRCCLLFACVDSMEYSCMFACNGSNQYTYSITKLNEQIYNDQVSAEIGKTVGVDLNQITFTNGTDGGRVLTIVELPFYSM